jgi:hypothetical protein
MSVMASSFETRVVLLIQIGTISASLPQNNIFFIERIDSYENETLVHDGVSKIAMVWRSCRPSYFRVLNKIQLLFGF